MSDNQQLSAPQAANPLGAESLLARFHTYVDGIPASRRKFQFFAWLAVAIVLTAAASFPIPSELRLIAVVVGTPAGILLFLLGAALVRTTRLGDAAVFRVRELVVPQRRVIYVVFGLVAIAAVVFWLSSTLPFFPLGVGGVVTICAALTAYSVLRRTPEEVHYAQQGIRDPRLETFIEEEEIEK